jgi:hypothetical protein
MDFREASKNPFNAHRKVNLNDLWLRPTRYLIAQCGPAQTYSYAEALREVDAGQ